MSTKRITLSFLLVIVLSLTTWAGLEIAKADEFDLIDDPKTWALYYQVEAKAWTGGVRYSLDGFVLHDKPASGMNPKQVSGMKYSDIPASSISCTRGETSGNGTFMTTCEISPDVIRVAFIRAGMDNKEFDANFYLSAYFIMSDRNGNFVDTTTKYYSYNDIINAPMNKYGVSWSNATKEYLKSFYNHAAKFKSSSRVFLVEVEKSKTWDVESPNQNLLRPITEVPPPSTHKAPDGNWRINEGFNFSLPISETIVVGNKTYKKVGIRESQYSVDAYYDRKPGMGPLDTLYDKIYFVVEYELQSSNEDCTGNGCGPSQGCTGAGCGVVPGGCTGAGCATGGPSAPSVTESRTNDASTMQPSADGVLKADNRGSEKFNVSQGIPTGESLYSHVQAKNYLYEFKFDKYSGTATWQVNVQKTYTLLWKQREAVGYVPCTPTPTGCTGGGYIYGWVDKYDTETVSQTYNVSRTFSYWAVDYVRVYDIKEAKVMNYSLPNGEVVLTPTGYDKPTLSVTKYGSWQDHLEYVIPSNVTLPPERLGGSSYTSRPSVDTNPNWSSYANSAVGNISVRNDRVVVNGTVVMDNNFVATNTAAPGNFPSQERITNNVLYKSGMMVLHDKLNGTYTSSGTITYSPVSGSIGGSEQSFTVSGLNSVRVHTPVVNYSNIPDDNRVYDQSVARDTSRTILVLGRNFTLNFNETGQHLNQTGYGNRDYSKYTAEKRVIFPFDVYVGNTLYTANTWISIPVGQNSTTFTLPTWVNEGNYTIVTQAWAMNDVSRSADSSVGYNDNINTYGASRQHHVKVVGRVYGFTVYDIGDLRYETVFRVAEGSTQHTGFMYYSGRKDKDGIPTAYANNATRLLPVRPGSHPSTVATTPHNGYPFLFYFNTVGNYWNANEGVRIEPVFYFVPKKGNQAPIEVDLYYDTTSSKLVRVGSELDRTLFSRVIRMDDPLRTVSQTYLRSAIGFEWDYFLTAGFKASNPRSQYIENMLKRNIEIGKGYKELVLNYKTRTLIGPVREDIPVPVDTQARSVQRWFGEYNLPIAPYILPKGTNLEELVRTKYGGRITGKESEFLKDGYIIVNFKITTYRNGKPEEPILAYDASPYGGANMWQIEDQVRSSTSYLGANFDYNYGDIIMFESDFSVRDDFIGGGRR